VTGRAFELAGIIDEPEAMLRALERYLSRRKTTDPQEAALRENEIPEELRIYDPGCRYGRYHEEIVKREVRREGWPEWFDPRYNTGQFGLVVGAYRVYIQVRNDDAARSAPSTFDEKIMGFVVPASEQASLFG
jgi:hypothetical protein